MADLNHLFYYQQLFSEGAFTSLVFKTFSALFKPSCGTPLQVNIFQISGPQLFHTNA